MSEQSSTTDETDNTPQEQWEDHNESFGYQPPQKPAEAWSMEEYQELHDRVITRRTEWFCDKCTGRGPFGSLQKARRHVEKKHGHDLIQQYALEDEELEAATDGGTSQDETAKRAEENHGLGEFVGGESA